MGQYEAILEPLDLLTAHISSELAYAVPPDPLDRNPRLSRHLGLKNIPA